MVTEFFAARPLDAEGWQDARDPRPLLTYLTDFGPSGRGCRLQVLPGRRKARHFAAACCRRVEHLFRCPHLSELLGLVEGYADGRVELAALAAARRRAAAGVVGETAEPSQLWDWLAREAHKLAPETVRLRATPAARLAHGACLVAAHGNSAEAVACWERTAEAAANAGGSLAAELAFQADLLRDLFGNPFEPVAFDPAWRTSAVVALAESATAAGDFGALPILADALQEAGCEEAAVLGHCRDGAVHARGCWVVDAILGA